jgi:hypothetical protein
MNEPRKTSPKETTSEEKYMAAETTAKEGSAVGRGEAKEEYVVTLNGQTGELLKVERLEKSGERKELTDEEYASMYSDYGAYDDYSSYAFDTTAYDPYGYEDAYYQGMSDFAATIGYDIWSQAGYSPEEAAYYQGMADYAAAVG